jgi:hypothetical protein
MFELKGDGRGGCLLDLGGDQMKNPVDSRVNPYMDQ